MSPSSSVTRGVVLLVRDMQTLDWPALAARAGLTTLATHVSPAEIAAFVRTERGAWFLESCRRHGLQVEHELHAMSDLLPRELYDRDPALFPMDEQGRRVRDGNLCVSSAAARQIACENAARYTGLLRSTTGRYFYWPEDGRPMCRCPECRHLSDSDQALLLENEMLAAIRQVDPRATLAHLAYTNTLSAPTQVRPAAGIFLEFAPIQRRHDVPISRHEARAEGALSHGEMLDHLDANLALFGREGAQVLEYWLDLSRYAGWNRTHVMPLPWHPEVLREDLRTYTARGIRHVTTFGAWLDGDYAARFGEPPVDDYGQALRETEPGHCPG